MLNVLSVDVEDYFHVEAFASHIRREQWDSYPPRVERNMALILELFDRHRVKATFFILGWVAEKFPALAKQIASGGHEVGCHGYAHRHLLKMTPQEFRTDIQKASGVLTGQTGQPVRCYRAPSFSIVRQTTWALEILAEEGFVFDSSIFPVRHDLYGMPDAERFPHWLNAVFEFPPSTIRRWNHNVGIGGGGYLRFMPYGLTHWGLQHINEVDKQPAMVYFHPWEIDPGQPRIQARFRSRLRHYTNLATMEDKITRLLRNFRFSTLSAACMEHRAYLAAPARSVAAAAGQMQQIAALAKSAGSTRP